MRRKALESQGAIAQCRVLASVGVQLTVNGTWPVCGMAASDMAVTVEHAGTAFWFL